MSVEITTIASPDRPLPLKDGGELRHVDLAYETWGQLNEAGDNAILVFHALSGAHNVTGITPENSYATSEWTPELHNGWWADIVGSGKAIDTDTYFVICANYLGGCYGSTGPASVNPDTGKRYGSTFPTLAVADQANAARRLLDQLGIPSLHAVVGPSVGGLCALTYATLYPDTVTHVISIASGFASTVLNRLILFEQILAIENDPHFNGGDYYGGELPSYGLALARMISHKTFVHLDSIERRARSEITQHPDTLAWYKVNDPFQSYMLHQGKKFVQRFDANTYLRIVDMWSRYKATSEAGVETDTELFAQCKDQRYLIFSIDSDFCFYPEEQAELVHSLERNTVPTTHITVHSDKGHDSFLLEPHLYAPHIAYQLSSQLAH